MIQQNRAKKLFQVKPNERNIAIEEDAAVKRTTSYKVANGRSFERNGKFNEHFVEPHHESSSSESETEKERLDALSSANQFRYDAVIKKRPAAKVRQGLQSSRPNKPLPSDVTLVVDDMDNYMQHQIVEITRLAIAEHPDEEDDGSLRAKFLKQKLDEELDPCWMVCCVRDQFWVGASFEPGFTFGFEIGGTVYMVWRTPSTKAAF